MQGHVEGYNLSDKGGDLHTLWVARISKKPRSVISSQRDQVTGQWNAITDTRIDYITTDIQLIGIRREREGTPIREKGNHEQGNATVRSERDEPES